MTLLKVENLSVQIPTKEGTVCPVQDVSFVIQEGEKVGIVGESGSGKSILTQTITRLLLPPGKISKGNITFEERDVLSLSKKKLQAWRGKEVSLVFQDPLTALNPFLRVGKQISEMFEIHEGLSRKEAKEKSIELLRRMDIPHPEERIKDYPHQFSGGMRQRVAIAIALACNPKLVFADEPTTALDVTVQTRVLDLLREVTQNEQTSVVLISHDLGVIANFCERIMVMYAGGIVEEALTTELIQTPLHPYTKGLLNSLPDMNGPRSDSLASIPGSPPDLTIDIKGCAFAPRCSLATDICRVEKPELKTISPGRRVACHEVKEMSL